MHFISPNNLIKLFWLLYAVNFGNQWSNNIKTFMYDIFFYKVTLQNFVFIL
jgi:hypothetical protein